MPDAHSKFSASAESRWGVCPGSMVLAAGRPDKASKYAAEGTVAHGLLEDYLRDGVPPEDRLGAVERQDGFDIEVDQEMVDAVRTAIGNIEEMTRGADILQAETRVNYSAVLGVAADDGWGTSDVIAVLAEQRELQVHDYKHGRGVAVDAADNGQLKLYGLGALEQFEGLCDIDNVRLVIHQPRVSQAPSEWVISVADLKAWGLGAARSAAASVANAERLVGEIPDEEWNDTFLRAGEEQCRWCRAKAGCPEARNQVVRTVMQFTPATPEDFEAAVVPKAEHLKPTDAVWLSAALKQVDFIEGWCTAVRAEVERRLLAGEPVPDFKLVTGKKGARAWADKEAVEKLLKGMRLTKEEMYDFELISPTTAEKLAPKYTSDGQLKPDQPDTRIGDRQWKKLKEQIKQAPGKPSVAPATDPRPAIEIKPVADEFEATTNDQPTAGAAACDFA